MKPPSFQEFEQFASQGNVIPIAEIKNALSRSLTIHTYTELHFNFSPRRGCVMKSFLVACLGLISLLYLLNIGVGFIELIPDNIPFIGNLDEGGAAMLLLMCLRYFGLDLTKIFEKDSKKEKSLET
jgi:hypothetical protein